MTAVPPRVLHVCDFHLKYATHLATGMAEAGCPVTLLTRDHDLEFGGVPGAMRTFVERTTGGRVQHRRLSGRVRDARSLVAVARLARELRRWAPDVVHLQEAVTNDVRLLGAAGVRPRRYALTVHDAREHLGEEWTPEQRTARHALTRGAGVIFVHSETVREELRRRFRHLPPVEIVPHGMAAPAVRRWTRCRGSGPSCPRRR
jgi:hypothetical protein